MKDEAAHGGARWNLPISSEVVFSRVKDIIFWSPSRQQVQCHQYASITGLYSALRDFEGPLVFPITESSTETSGGFRKECRQKKVRESSEGPVDHYPWIGF